MANAEVNWGESPGSSTAHMSSSVGKLVEPLRLETVRFASGTLKISGNAEAAARMHRADRAFDLFETLTLAGLATVAIAMSALMVMYAPDGREFLVLGLSVTGWVLALGLSGYAAIRIKASKSGVQILGRADEARPPRNSAAYFTG